MPEDKRVVGRSDIQMKKGETMSETHGTPPAVTRGVSCARASRSYHHLRHTADTRPPPPRSYVDKSFRTLVVPAAMILLALISSPAALADDPPCLINTHGDGHPIFGNPKYSMMHCDFDGCETMGPLALAMGDLDGDGDLDFAIANSAYYAHLGGVSGDLTIMLNQGDGMFVDETYYEAGYEPRSVALGDLDGDGDLDVAVASSTDDAVFVLLGYGDGTFAPATSFAVGDAPRSVAIGDVDGDGTPDLAVLNAMSNDVSVLMGNGDGTFAPQATYGVGIVGDYPERWLPVGGVSIALRDLDGDGDLDLVTANCGQQGLGTCLLTLPPGSVSVLLNNGDGTYAAQVEYTCDLRTVNLALGDLDEDGDPDVVASNLCNGTVSVLLNNGDGTLAPQVTYEANGYEGPLPPGAAWFGGGPASLALGDVEGDGHLDLAVGYQGSYYVSLLPGNGDGTFGDEATLFVDQRPVFVDLGDLNGDGGLDLAVLAPGSNQDSLSVIFNFGDGVFLDDETTELLYWVVCAAIGDLDGDADLDLAVAGGGSRVSVLLNHGDATFDQVAYGVGFKPYSVAMGDVDADGDLDLAVANGGGGMGVDDTVSVLLNNGDGTFAAQVTYDAGPSAQHVAIGDLDHDGDADLAVANLWGPTVSVLLSNGDGTFAGQVQYATGNYPRSVVIGDLDGDTHPDLVTVNGFPHGVTVLAGNGDGTFGAAVVAYDLSGGPEPMRTSLGDLDGDGDLDVVVGFNNNPAYPPPQPNVQVLLNDGAGVLSDGGSYLVPGTWQTDSLAIGDLDGDGVPDLALTNAAQESVSVLLGQGDGTFADGVAYARAHGPNPGVVLGDLDGDGDLDLAVTNGDEHVGLSVLRNRTCRAVPVPGDLNGDGIVDLADIGGFVACLLDPAPAACLAADINGDGTADGLDIAPFVDAVLP